jgi:DeoR family fructose operon transcriptional repressor
MKQRNKLSGNGQSRNELSGSERRIRILNILREKKEVTIAELAEQFGVSVMTIRRDLHYYEDQGILDMHYGGATLREIAPPFADFSRRGESHRTEKREIAVRAAKEIRENDILFLDTSTTVLPVIDYLPDVRLTVVTNSLPALVRLAGMPKVRAIACPGEYRELYGGLMDLSTVEFLRQYHFPKAFLGASLCEPDFGISCDEEIEAVIKRTILAQSDRTWFLIDDSKMHGHNFIRICGAEEPEAIFTNTGLSVTTQKEYREMGARLILCP